MSMTQHRTMKSAEFPEFPRLYIRTGRLEIRWQDTLKPQIEFRKKTLIVQAPEEHWNWSLFHPFPFWLINLATLDTDFFPKQDVFLRLKLTGSYLDGCVGRRRIFSLFCRRDGAPESRRNPEFSLSRTIFFRFPSHWLFSLKVTVLCSVRVFLFWVNGEDSVQILDLFPFLY